MSNPVFSEQQVQEILKRAVQLHEDSQSTTYTAGITLEELNRIAEELGVSPTYLEQAIRESKVPEVKAKISLVKEFEEVVDGEIDPDNFDVLTPLFRTVHSQNAPRQVGRSLQAQSWSGIGYASVDVTSRNGRTKIRARSLPLGPFLLGAYPAFIAAIVTTAALGKSGMAGTYAPFIWGGALLAGGAAFRALLTKSQQGVANLVKKIKETVIENVTITDPEVKPTVEETEEVRQKLGG